MPAGHTLGTCPVTTSTPCSRPASWPRTPRTPSAGPRRSGSGCPTPYPGTTEEVVRPLLEKGSGLTAVLDFSLAFSPERIDPGNPAYDIRNTPKVVGGV